MGKFHIFGKWFRCGRPRCCHFSGTCCCPPEPPAEPAEDVFASFATFEVRFENGQAIQWGTGAEDPSGAITLEDNSRIMLEPGYYAVTYSVSAVLDQAGYMQITPYWNGSPHLEYGVYFRTAAGASSACGSGEMILQVPSRTPFTLHYNSDVSSRSGAAMITVLKLNRA